MSAECEHEWERQPRVWMLDPPLFLWACAKCGELMAASEAGTALEAVA